MSFLPSSWSSVGHAFLSAGHAVTNAAGQAVGAVATINRGISEGVENFIDPDLPRLTVEYKRKVAEYNGARSAVIDAYTRYQSVREDYQGYAAFNASLMISAAVAQMTDVEMDTFLALADRPLQALSPQAPLPSSVAEFVRVSAGGSYGVNVLYQMAGVPGIGPVMARLGATGMLGDVLRTLGDDDLGRKSWSDGGGALIGQIGSFAMGRSGLCVPPSPLSLAADMWFRTSELQDGIAGAKRRTAELMGDTARVNAAIESMALGILGERQTFLAIMKSLTEIQPAAFVWELGPGDSDAAWKAAMMSAIVSYNVVQMIRVDWTLMNGHNSSLRWQDFLLFESMKRQPHVTPAQFLAFAEWVRSRSASMQRSATLSA